MATPAHSDEIPDERALLSAVFDDVPDAIVVADERHRVMLANPAARDVFGYPPEELVSKPLSLLCDSQDEYRQLETSHHPDNGNATRAVLLLNYRRQNGAVFPGETVTTVIRGQGHSLTGNLFMIRDVSERSHQQQEEARARQRLEDALEALDEAFSLWDADDRLVLTNSRYRRLYPRSAHLLTPGVRFEAVLRHAVEHKDSNVPLEQREQWVRDRLHRHRNPPERPVTQRRDDGRWILVAERPTRDGSIAGIRMDITAQKRTENALRELASLSSMPDTDLDARFEQLLRLGTEHFGLPYGIISVVDGDKFTLRNSVSPDVELLPGTTFAVHGTLCGRTLEKGFNYLVGPDARDSTEDPIVRSLGIRGYAGIAYQVNHVRAGTVCFFSREPREEPIASSDRELLRLFGQWVGYEIERNRTLEELRRTRAELERLATIDELTGLRNRRALLTFGRAEFKRARRFGNPLCVLAIDVDFFKKVNDTVGHAGGDRVLRDVASCCRASVRSADGVGRIGGEEFVLVLVETEQGPGEEVGERIRLSVAEVDVGADTPVTASIGVAQLGRDDEDFEALLARADAALYLAKKSGRNRVCLAPA